MAGLAAAYCLLAAAGVPIVLAALLTVAGLLLAPTTVVGSTLLDRVAPPGTATEAFTVMVMGIVAGTAVGNGLGGAIVEGAAFEAAVLWPAPSRPRARWSRSGFGDADLADDDRIDRLLVGPDVDDADLVDDLLALRDLAEQRIVGRQPGILAGDDEELAAGGAGGLGRVFAIATMPGCTCRLCGGASTTLYSGPPVPSPSGSPPWITKSGTMRWKTSEL